MAALGRRSRSRVTIVSPSIRGRGGIASVVRCYVESSLACSYDLRVVETVTGSGLLRHIRGLAGVAGACIAVLSHGGGVVHAHVSHGGSFWRKAVVLAWSKAVGSVTVLHVHSSRFRVWAESGGVLRRRAVAGALRRADSVVALSHVMSDELEQLSGRCDVRVIPNPTLLPSQPSAGVGGRSVVFLGRLGDHKGVYDLIEAVRLLQEEGFHAKYLLAGDGEVSDVVECVMSLPFPEEVSVPGWLSRDEVRSVLAESAVFCLPSYGEGLPAALLEAMAFGLACVVTPVGGVPEVIDGGRNGEFVEVHNSESLRDGLRRVLSDPEYARLLGLAARQEIVQRFTVELVIAAVKELYVSLGYAPLDYDTSADSG